MKDQSKYVVGIDMGIGPDETVMVAKEVPDYTRSREWFDEVTQNQRIVWDPRWVDRLFSLLRVIRAEERERCAKLCTGIAALCARSIREMGDP